MLHVKNKIAKSLSLMYKVKYLIDETALLTIYTREMIYGAHAIWK